MEKIKLWFWVPFVFALFSFSPNNDLTPSQSYVQTYLPLAIEEMEKFGIPVSVKLAQGILESDNGNSALALGSNNHFGIKCKNYWIGPTYYHPDDDFDREGRLIDSCFRVYRSIGDSYRDHSIFLKYSTHYRPLFELDPLDYRGWARQLQQIGYATNPRYAQMLIGIIERYELHKFDQMVVLGE
nr:glucosaminidase domain-containing protein [Saprospiraceae bacterium]